MYSKSKSFINKKSRQNLPVNYQLITKVSNFSKSCVPVVDCIEFNTSNYRINNFYKPVSYYEHTAKREQE
jgi:hypothetical protein